MDPAQHPDHDEIERVKERLAAFVGDLERRADEQVSKKVLVEDRWYEDLRQYHGKYDSSTLAALKEAGKSTVFIGLTRAKTHAWEARLSDMLFPTDDKNWGIQSTPVPALSNEAREATEQARQAAKRATQAMQAGDPMAAQAAVDEGNAAAEIARQRKAEADEAKHRAELMEHEIEDQLVECQFTQRSRDAIHDGCKLGTAIMKGPLTSNRTRRRWEKVGGGAYELAHEDDRRPEIRRVDPWSFFPDMSAATIDEAEFTFERHLPNKRELRKWAKIPGFDKDAIRRLLEHGSRADTPNYLGRLRDITGQNQTIDDRFVVWEYHGPIEHDQLEALVAGTGREIGDLGLDALDELNVIIWFCQGEVLKFGIHPLESGDSLYSVWNFERDETSIFGFGVPALMRDSQSVMNGAWRMMMDNMGLGAGPQVVIDQSLIAPADMKWELAPQKIWWQKKPLPSGSGSPFQILNIETHQASLAAVVAMARQLADEETNMPVFAQGEPGSRSSSPAGAETMGGMAMLMNSANVVFRRVVRNWDDDMTTPTLRRMYEWNMQFNEREDIKGDMDVAARGSSVLLVRELQTQNLMAIATQWSAHPVLGGIVKVPEAARKTVQGMMITADDVIKTDDEIREEQELAAQQPPAPTPDMIKLQVAQIEAESRLQIAHMNRETELIKMAESQNMQLSDLKTKLELKDREIRSKERVFAAELAGEKRLMQREAETGATRPGSGGHF